MRVKHRNSGLRVDVTPDGHGLISNSGTMLLARVADRTDLTANLCKGLSGVRERASVHDPGRVIRDLAVMLAAGGEAVTDLGALRGQECLFGKVASDSTVYRLVEKLAGDPEYLGMIQDARLAARSRVWGVNGKPGRVTIDLDGTLVNSHSEKEGAAGNFKGGFGFHPMMAFLDETSEAAAAVLRPGNAGANTADDQILAAELALAQIPGRGEKGGPEVLLRTDTAGAVHDLLDWARKNEILFSAGFDLTQPVKDAILSVPEKAWKKAVNQNPFFLAIA